MGKFYVKDGQFWIDDEAQLIQAGEFHYFRTPVDQWEHRLSLLQNAVTDWHRRSRVVKPVDG